MPETLRAALRKVSWRSSARAAEASCKVSITDPGRSGSSVPCTVIPVRRSRRGPSSTSSCSTTVSPRLRTWVTSWKIGLSAGSISVSAWPRICSSDRPRKFSAALFAYWMRSRASSSTTGTGRLSIIAV